MQRQSVEDAAIDVLRDVLVFDSDIQHRCDAEQANREWRRLVNRARTVIIAREERDTDLENSNRD